MNRVLIFLTTGFIQNLAGFMRTTDSPTHNLGRLHRETTDLTRKIKFISTTDASFVIKQFLLQSQNRTMRSRI